LKSYLVLLSSRADCSSLRSSPGFFGWVAARSAATHPKKPGEEHDRKKANGFSIALGPEKGKQLSKSLWA